MSLMMLRIEVSSPPGVSISSTTSWARSRAARSSDRPTYSAVAGPMAPAMRSTNTLAFSAARAGSMRAASTRAHSHQTMRFTNGSLRDEPAKRRHERTPVPASRGACPRPFSSVRRRADVRVEGVTGRRVGRHPPRAEQRRVADEAGGQRDLERIERREGGDVVPSQHEGAARAQHRERGAQRLGELVAVVDAEAVDAIAHDAVEARCRQVLLDVLQRRDDVAGVAEASPAGVDVEGAEAL